MVKRSKDCVFRSHRFNEDNFRYYYSKLLMFWPWRKESELIGNYRSYFEHYNAVMDVVECNAVHFNLNSKEIDEAMEEFEKNPPTVSEWLDAGIGVEELCEEELEIEEDGIGGNLVEEQKAVPESSLSLKYKFEAHKDVLSCEEYCKMMRSLNKEQREVVMFNRSWVKECISKMRKGDDPESYQIFFNGPGGSGKSHVIKMIYRDNVKFYRRFFVGRVSESCEVGSCGDDVIGLLCAYTGTAAFNIDGMTLHSLRCTEILSLVYLSIRFY